MDAFEKELAESVGDAAPLDAGTAALHLGLKLVVAKAPRLSGEILGDA